MKIINDILYTQSLQPDVESYALDIYAPVQSGSWPVIILVHDIQDTKDAFVRMGKSLAREGAVVFIIEWPAWASLSPAMSGDGAALREWTKTFNCAVRFAHVEAANYTHNNERVTLVGHSTAGWLGLLAALSGDGMDAQWQAYEASHGGPPPQTSCVITKGSAHVDAFVGYGGLYTQINFAEEQNPDFMKIMSVSQHIGENQNLRIRAIQGIYDTDHDQAQDILQTSEGLILMLAGAGYDAKWIEVDGGYSFSASGELGEKNRQIIMDAARP